MSVSRGYRLPAAVVKQRRPFGVAVFGILGMLGSVLVIGALVFGLWSLMRISVEPSPQVIGLIVLLLLAFVILRINWGFWELLRWAWWANLLLTALSIAGAVFGMRYIPALAQAIHSVRLTLAAATIETFLHSALLGLIVLDVIVALYLFAAHAAFGVGVKDERPLWEKARKH